MFFFNSLSGLADCFSCCLEDECEKGYLGADAERSPSPRQGQGQAGRSCGNEALPTSNAF